VLDGNVIRVLTRLWAIRKDPQNPRVKERLWGIATELVQQALCTPRIPAPASERAWVYGAGPCSQLNQALMELGAVICTPREPACSTCPLRKLCVARARDLTTVLPVTGTTIIYTARRFLAFVVQDHSRFLVRQRPRAGLNAELWEFPSVEVTPTFTHTTNSAVSHCPGAPPNVGALCTIKHCQTRYRITLQVFQAVVCRRKIPTRADERWLTLKQLDALPFSSAHRRILDRLRTIPVH
jgi:A/G-specific adenine glycosylase